MKITSLGSKPKARIPPGLVVRSIKSSTPQRSVVELKQSGPRIVTLQDRKFLSEDDLDRMFMIEEPRRPKEELLADPRIQERVKKLIRRSSLIAQRTPEWFKMRRGKVTGSAVASVLGRNKYQSRAKLMRQKLGIGPKFEGNKFTRHGNRFEAVAAAAYEKKTGNTLIEMDLGLMAHPDEHYECIAASCDGVTYNGILIEIKCPYARQIIPGVVPGHYIDQIQMNLFVHQLDLAHFVQFKPAGFKGAASEVLEIVEVPYDPLWIKLNFPMIKKFSEELLEGLKDKDRKEQNVITVDLFPNKHHESIKTDQGGETEFLFI